MNIKLNKVFFLAMAFAFIVAGCKKETFNYQMFNPKVEQIDSIYFSPGAHMLVADGQASLQFVIETYRTIKVPGSGGSADSLVEVDYKGLPEGSLQILKDGQPYNKMEFSTNQYSSTPITFSVKVGQATSQNAVVTLRPKQVLPQKLKVDVVFHIFELKNTDPTYDPLTYQPVTEALLVAAIKDMNDVFNNKLGNDPNGGSANLEFRLAAKTPSGSILKDSGFDKIMYDKSWQTYSYGYSPNDFFNKVNTTASYTWDPTRYLNIYMIPSGANNSMGNNTPKYQIVPTGQDPIGGIASIINDPSGLPTGQNYQVYGVGIPRTLLFPGTERRIELSPYLGTYYGLLRTGVSSPTYNDYCNDTRKYLASGQFGFLVKTGFDGMKFLADNAMDDNRYPSLRNSFTIDQVERIRAVMANCPNRWHGHP